MPLILRILVMHFERIPRLVVHLLIKSPCCLLGVNLFHIPGGPSLTPDYVKPVPPPAVGQCLPLWKLLFILLARTHAYPTPVSLRPPIRWDTGITERLRGRGAQIEKDAGDGRWRAVWLKSGACPRIAQCSRGTRCSFLCNGSKRRRSPADPAVRPALHPGAHAVSPA